MIRRHLVVSELRAFHAGLTSLFESRGCTAPLVLVRRLHSSPQTTDRGQGIAEKQPEKPEAAAAGPRNTPVAASSAGGAEATGSKTAERRELRRHPKLHRMMVRELREEQVRDHRPPLPHVPTGWTLEHRAGSNRFDLRRTVDVRQCGVEHLHVIALMEIKQYEHTYRMDNGEREEEQHVIFSLFVEKERWRTSSSGGGLEFTLTSIDQELVLDNVAIHETVDAFERAKTLRYSLQKEVRDTRYRGPMISELDEDLTDELLDYLDERGINNAFAEYIMSQAHYLEQQSYEDWLGLLKQFAQ